MANKNIVILPSTTPQPITGSLILKFNEFINSLGTDQVIVSINGVLRKRQYTDVIGLYMWNLNLDDVVLIQISTTNTSYRKVWNVNRIDYTTLDTESNLGLINTFITSGFSYSNPGTFTFTVAKDALSYNFEYVLDISTDNAPTPTPTATPTSTPTPTPTPTSTPIGPTPTPTPTPTITPGPSPTPTPLPCTFYIGSGFTSVQYFITTLSSGNYVTGGNYAAYLNGPSTPGSGYHYMRSIDTTGYNYPLWNVDDLENIGATPTVLHPNPDGTSYTWLNSGNFYKLNTDGDFNNNPALSWNNNFNGYLNPVGMGGPSPIYDCDQQSTGKVVIAGGFNYYYKFSTGINSNYRRIIRFNTNGTLDTTFNNQISGLTESGSYFNSIIVDPSDKIMCIGEFGIFSGVTCNKILRLNSNGTLDNTFNTGNSGFFGSPKVIKRISSGQYYIAGNFITYNGTSVNNIIRINADGTLDTSFTAPLINNSIYTIAIQTDGKVIIGGLFDKVNGVTFNKIARLNTNGTLDTVYNPFGNGFNDYVASMTINSSNVVVAVGPFTSFNSQSTPYIAAINSDGSSSVC